MVMPTPESELGQEMLRKVPPAALPNREEYQIELRHPNYGRIQVPLRNKWCLRRTAEILETLAAELRRIARNTDISSNRATVWAHDMIKAVNRDLQEATKSGESDGI